MKNEKRQLIGYKRVSTYDQATDRQLHGLDLDKIFEDKISGKFMKNRPQLIACIDYLRSGDILYVNSLDRLARNLLDLKKIITEVTSKGGTVIFVKEGLTFTPDKSDHVSEFMLNILGAIHEFQRAHINEDIRAGVAIAKAKGAYKNHGRKVALTDEQIEEIKIKQQNGLTKKEIMKLYNIGTTTYYKYIHKNKQVL